MNNNQIIGENLKRLRSDRRLSLSQLAEACDVSKVVLSQIERGEANPTVNTIWKIAAGLKVPYTELLDNKSKETTIIHRDEAIEQIALDGNYKSYIYLSVSHDCVLTCLPLNCSREQNTNPWDTCRDQKNIFLSIRDLPRC